MTEKPQAAGKVVSKNRASRAGTRTVASLTPEQLARKRANDREAQRSIRLRTKTRISDLEKRIRELSGEHDERVLEAVCKRNLELEEELKHLRHLSEALRESENDANSSPESMMVPAIVAQMLIEEVQSGLGSWDDQQQQISYLPPWNWNSRVPHNGTDIPPTFYGNENSEEMMSGGYASPALGVLNSNHQSTPNQHINASEPIASHTTPAPVPIPGRGIPPIPVRSNQVKSSSYPRTASSPSPVLRSTSSTRYDTNSSNLSFTSHPTDRILNLDHSASSGTGKNGRNSGAVSVSNLLSLESTHTESDTSTTDYSIPSSLPFLPQMQPSLYPWEISLPFHSPVNAIESMLLGCLQQLRPLNSPNIKRPKKPWQPNIKGLIYPELRDEVQGVDLMLSDLVKSMALLNLPIKVGFFYLVHRFLQWQAALDEDSWNCLPPWMRPEPVQLSNRHPIIASLIFWPNLRKATIESQPRYFSAALNPGQSSSQNSFNDAYISSLNLSWPYADTDIFSLPETGSDEIHVSDTFLTHIQDLANWSLDPGFWESLP
ncbi:putative bzip transcription [Golovinomyces cichoracearum]|uniref:Putative bzip transcription n=1 Tax=Golovinomyces cichoracearum TaxID=62708 RepID=A0A420HFS6_9PEZI|nr:putative bzip transcription [Golovinomyces cichoracearum]